MAITGSSILYGGTVSASAGTATGMIPKGDTANARTTILDNAAAFIDQIKVEFTVAEPKVQASAPNGYTQGRNSVRLLVPLALDNGNRTVNTVDIRIACDHETTDAERLILRTSAAQLLTDSDFADFWNKQSLA